MLNRLLWLQRWPRQIWEFWGFHITMGCAQISRWRRHGWQQYTRWLERFGWSVKQGSFQEIDVDDTSIWGNHMRSLSFGLKKSNNTLIIELFFSFFWFGLLMLRRAYTMIFFFPSIKMSPFLIKRKNKETIRIKYFPHVYPYQMSLLKFAMQLAKTPSIMIGVFIFFPESYLKKKLWGWKRTSCSCDCCIASSRKRASVESSILACQ